MIESFTKADILEFFRDRISPSSASRAKLSVHLQSQHLSAQTAQKLPGILAEAGVTDVPPEYIAMLSASPLPLLSDIEMAVPVELQKQGKADQTEKVLKAIRESHLPSSLGEGKEIINDAAEIRKRFSLGPHSAPTEEEYQKLFAKL